MPPPLYAARCGPAPAHTRLTPETACGAQRALLPAAVRAANVHGVRNRRRQTSDIINA